MSLNNGDVVSITVEQELLGEDVLNVFYYVWDTILVGVELLDLLLKFKATVWDAIRKGQNPDVSAVNFVARNLTNGVDIDNSVGPVNGLDTTGGDVSPSYVAAGYTLQVATLITRPGSKRFAGTSEGRVNDNVYDAGGTVAVDIQNELADVLPVSGAVIGSGLMTPQIIGRDVLGALELGRKQAVSSALVSTTIRSQVSRREG